MWPLVFGLAFLAICRAVYQLVGIKRRWCVLGKIPCRQPLPLLGNLPDFLTFISGRGNIPPITYIFQYLHGMTALFPDKGMFALWAGPKPWLFLLSPESVEPVLSSNQGQDISTIHKYMQPWLGNGLLTSKGEEWQRNRKLLNQSFHVRFLEKSLPVMNEQAAILVEKILEASAKNNFIDSFDFHLKCTLDIICETALDVKIDAQGSDSIYAKMINEALDGIFARFNRPWLSPDILFRRSIYGRKFQEAVDYLHEFSDKVIASKLSTAIVKQNLEAVSDQPIESKAKKNLSLLDLLLGSGLSQQEIREQVDTIIFAGFETTGIALGWTTYLLGLHPDVQDRLIEEIDGVFHDARDRHVTLEDLRNLKYMEMVIKESLRMYPTVTVYPKKLPTDTEIGGYLIPKGTECIVFPYSVHRNPRHYMNPDAFDPERFSPENSVGRHPCAFVPFSSGLRNCIGQRYGMIEMKIICCHILRTFRIVSLDPLDKVLLLPTGSLKPLTNIRTKFIPRVY